MARRNEVTVGCEDTMGTRTIHMALDLGRRCWTVGFVLAGDRDAGLYQIAGGGKRLRKIGIVAVARKLMIALWRYLTQGVIPEGAVVK